MNNGLIVSAGAVAGEIELKILLVLFSTHLNSLEINDWVNELRERTKEAAGGVSRVPFSKVRRVRSHLALEMQESTRRQSSADVVAPLARICPLIS